jgi:acyl CoA:acetate/3-ketoacid CoA transferase beta subunit
VLDVTADGLLVREVAEGVSRDDLRALTGAPLRFTSPSAVLR